jgi:hypothetical protein
MIVTNNVTMNTMKMNPMIELLMIHPGKLAASATSTLCNSNSLKIPIHASKIHVL